MFPSYSNPFSGPQAASSSPSVGERVAAHDARITDLQGYIERVDSKLDRLLFAVLAGSGASVLAFVGIIVTLLRLK